jgi:hypothetical protein
MTIFVSGSDESAGKTQRDTFLFGGWVAPESDWSRFFAPAWQERVLDGPPRIPYLHMTDIRSPQWRDLYGISKRDADDRINTALHLIHTTPSLYPISIRVDAGFLRDRFAKVKVKALRVNAKVRAFEPDFVCFLFYAWVALKYLKHSHPDAEKLNFIVERNGAITSHIQDFHSTLAENFATFGDASLAKLVGKIIPGSKDRVPLQAADVLCWHTARSRHPDTMDLTDRGRYSILARREGIYQELTHKQISQMAEALGVPPAHRVPTIAL